MAYPHQLPELGYPAHALEPHIDARTMEIHHGKHHAAYTANLNAALKDYPHLHGARVEDLLLALDNLPAPIQTAVRNNGGGFLNHSLFWETLAPGGAREPVAGPPPEGALDEAIMIKYGGFDEFKAEFAAAAATRFGSGWAWLSTDAEGDLEVTSTPNQDTPVMDGRVPLLGLDVWEHAYYLRYQNRRPDYIDAFWNVVNWNVVEGIFERNVVNPDVLG